MEKCETLFLLGAGASYESGLPLAKDLFDLLLSDLQDKNKKWFDLINYLKEISDNSFEDAISSLDFINSQNFSDYEIKLTSYLSGNNININKEKLVDIYNLVDYIKRNWINKYFKVLDKCKTQYLIPFVKYAKEENAEIFTLNYDNTLEVACESANINYSIGLSSEKNELNTQFFSIDNYKDNTLNIHKLHGSIDLFISQLSADNLYNNVYRPLVKFSDNDSKIFDKPAIILGSKNKLTTEAMYLDLLLMFNTKIQEAKQIFIIGYGFADSHINKFVHNTWFNYSDKEFFIIDPCIITDEELPPRSFIHGAYSIKGTIDYRNIFYSSENIQNNKLYLLKDTFSNFIRKIN